MLNSLLEFKHRSRCVGWSTDWTDALILKPVAETLGMEAMAEIAWERSDFVTLIKFTKADGAVFLMHKLPWVILYPWEVVHNLLLCSLFFAASVALLNYGHNYAWAEDQQKSCEYDCQHRLWHDKAEKDCREHQAEWWIRIIAEGRKLLIGIQADNYPNCCQYTRQGAHREVSKLQISTVSWICKPKWSYY